MEKFQGKYRIASARWQNWNYGWNGAYFITICTKNRINYFGRIVEGKMQLSHRGIVADILWYEIKNHADNLELGEFVVMPNHVHGVLILNDNNCDRHPNDNDERRDKACLVSTTTETAIDNGKTIGQQRFQNQGKNTISSIIGGYKSAVTKHIHRLGFDFAWQPRFHDYVIRNDRAYDRIIEYIKNNSRNWNRDKFYER